MATKKPKNAQVNVVPTIEDIEKVLNGVISKDPSQVTETERRSISVLVDKYISQKGGLGDELFSKVKIADKEYTLGEVLSPQHIDAPITLGKLEGLQAQKVRQTLSMGAGSNTAEFAFELIKNGADPDKQYPSMKNGATLMHVLAYYGASEQFENAAKEHGGNPNVLDGNGNTPAHYLLGNTSLLENIPYLKPLGPYDDILIAHPDDLGVTKIAKTLNVMRDYGTDFGIKNAAGKTPSQVFDTKLRESIVTAVNTLSEEKKLAACEKVGIELDKDGSPIVTNEVVDKIIGVGTDQYNWSGHRIAKAAIHDVVVDKKEAPVLYEGYETRGQKPQLKEAPKEIGVLDWVGDLFSKVELKDATQSQQAMTQRDAAQVAATKGATQIT